jgi:hemerythrin-like domain-containing protein
MIVAGELLILTREHHSALSLANKCVNAVKAKDEVEIQTLCEKISENFKIDFSEHFETEESTIFAFLSEKSDDLAQLCNQLILEHQQLYKMASELTNNSEYLEKFGKLLKSHARLENRELFPNIDLLSPKQRREILNSSAKHASATIYE